MVPRQILVTLVLAIAGLATAQQPPDWVRFHRKSAGTLDSHGWTTAVSTDGKFTVRLPCQFNDFTMDTREQDGPVAKTFMLGCLRQDKRKFMASQVSYKAGDGAARQRFELNVQALGMPGIRSKRESTFDGYRVLDIEARNENSCSFMRYVLVEPTQIAMIVEAPLAECDDLAADSRVFFSSLRVRP